MEIWKLYVYEINYLNKIEKIKKVYAETKSEIFYFNSYEETIKYFNKKLLKKYKEKYGALENKTIEEEKYSYKNGRNYRIINYLDFVPKNNINNVELIVTILPLVQHGNIIERNREIKYLDGLNLSFA